MESQWSDFPQEPQAGPSDLQQIQAPDPLTAKPWFPKLATLRFQLCHHPQEQAVMQCPQLGPQPPFIHLPTHLALSPGTSGSCRLHPRMATQTPGPQGLKVHQQPESHGPPPLPVALHFSGTRDTPARVSASRGQQSMWMGAQGFSLVSPYSLYMWAAPGPQRPFPSLTAQTPSPSPHVPYVASVHDGHHQTEVSFGFKRVGQRDYKPAVYLR